MIHMNIEKLKAHGFVETTYEGQEGIFMSKKIALKNLPFADFLLDNFDWHQPDDVVVMECFDAFIQGSIECTEYTFEPMSIYSKDGENMLEQSLEAESV